MEIEFSEFAAAIDAVLTTPVCTQCYLGYADVMWLDFGNLTPQEDLPPRRNRPPTKQHPKPEYEFDSGLCHWELTVCGEMVASSYDDPNARAEVPRLVGKRLLHWERYGLAEGVFEFEDNIIVAFFPYENQPVPDAAWTLTDKAGWLSVMCNNGRTYRYHNTVPLNQWFTETA